MNWGRENIPLRRLREILERHRGLNRAILSRDLAVLLGVRETDGRSLRERINELIEAGCPIGSSTTEGGAGYFWITNEYELRTCLAQLGSRIRELEKRREHLVRAFRHGPRQLGLLDAASPQPS